MSSFDFTKFKQKKISLCIALVLVFFCPSSSFSFNLSQIVELAKYNDPDYRSALSERSAGELSKDISIAGLLPSISANVGFNKNEVDRSFSGNASNQLSYNSQILSITARQPLLNFDAWGAYKQGLITSDRSDKVYTKKTQDLMLRIVNSYLEIVFSNYKLASLESQMFLSSELENVYIERFRNGEATKLELLNSATQSKLIAAQLIEAKNSANLANEKLKRIIGRDPVDILLLCRDPASLKLVVVLDSYWEQLVVNDNPDIQVKRVEIQFLEKQRERTLAAHAPSVDLIASYSKNTSESVLYYNQKIDAASIGVSMNIPIYKGGHTSAASTQASLLLEQSRSELNALISSNILDLRKYFFAHETILARLDALKFSEMASLESIRASEIAIVNGTGSKFDLLLAKQKLAVLENQMNDVKYEFFSNYFKIHNVTGHLTSSVLTSFDQCNQ